VFGVESNNETLYGPSAIPGYRGNGGVGYSCQGFGFNMYISNPVGPCKDGDVLSWHKGYDGTLLLYINMMYVGSGRVPAWQDSIATVAMVAPSVVSIRNDLHNKFN